MSDGLGSTMGILHGNPRNGEMRFVLELRTEDAPVGPSQFSFPGGKREECDKSVRGGFMREMREEFGLEFPDTFYRWYGDLEHVTNKEPLSLFDLSVPAPANLYTREGAGVVWFTIDGLIALHTRTLVTPGDKYVMTPATEQVFRYFYSQRYFLIRHMKS